MNNFPVPNEILLKISEHLSGSDLVSLSATCKTLCERVEGILFETRARSQRYYTSAVELKRLVRFSQHPRGATSFLRTLVIDLFCPYFYDIIGNFSLENIGAAKLVLLEYCNAERRNYAGEIRYRSQLLAKALRNLPNLEIVEFAITTPKDMPRRSVRNHFSDMKFTPTDFESFYNNYIEYSRWDRDIESIPPQIIDTVLIASLPRLTTIRASVKVMDREQNSRSCSLPLWWFTDKVRYHSKSQDKLAGLRDLTICASKLSKDYGRSDGATEKMQIDSLISITRFLNELTPNLETLVYSSSYLALLYSWNETEMKWPDSMDRFYTKWAYWFPGIHIDEPKLFLPKLKTLEFRYQAFIPEELISFLRAHQSTLRNFTIRGSVTEGKYQNWSPIFQLLESELKLEFFLCDGLSTYPSYGNVPWFEMRGNLREGSHVCELVPGYSTKMDLKTALWRIKKLEGALEAKARQTNGKWVWDSKFTELYYGNGRIYAEDAELQEKLRFDENFIEHSVFGRKRDFPQLQTHIENLYTL
ncbi:hypothetical protein TWF694_000967 [Orbilia ellipsospora]|uniref:F-box domain-containing protein n=1 Tax=Orbilia ellipsospora TaxID=2528407 RepID=A0AAV9XQ91_9PEZI